MSESRRLDADRLVAALHDARQLTLASSMDLDDARWMVPYAVEIQPVAWDLAHIGWFAEFWLLRGPHRLGRDGLQNAAAPPRWFGPDEHYDSAQIAHRNRWRIELLSREQLQERLAAQLAAVQTHIAANAGDPDTRYFAHLSLFHELMHVEALAWTRNSLQYPAPPGVTMPRVPKAEQIAVSREEHDVGTDPITDFAFDNEMPRHRVHHDAFSIDSQPVRNDAFAAFVDDDGYSRAEFWPSWWLASRDHRTMPARWRRAEDGSFEHRHYDRWSPLPPDEPIVHVNALEAEAYCRWAKRRLPEAWEWEIAAGYGMQWGHSVWEWTATTFAPYGFGFRPGPYTTYSAPWFHHQREVRGGAYTTHALMHDRRYRNFFLAHRTDVFTGFRTAADA